MTKAFPTGNREFYLTATQGCPYLPGRRERKVFTFLGGEGADALNAELSARGFRRSQNIAYLPACERCSACRPVRVLTDGFDERPWRRVLRRNQHVTRRARPPRVTQEQFSLLRAYLDARHAEGGMTNMTVLDYAAMVEQTPVDTEVHEYRDPDGTLVACALTDRLAVAESTKPKTEALTDRLAVAEGTKVTTGSLGPGEGGGLSMVYSFFAPDAPRRSLGSYVILDHVAQARAAGLPAVYLGYWVEGSPKMDYKRRFAPLEVLGRDGWRPMPAATTPAPRRPAP